MKLCAESIAFFGGGERERQIVDRRFEALLKHDWQRIRRRLKHVPACADSAAGSRRC